MRSEAREAIAAIVPSGAAFAGGALTELADDLWPMERALIAASGPERVRDFTAGRFYARRALARLGAAAGPIAMRADKCPAWPEGFVGAISHGAGFCGALVGRAERFVALGFDVEEAGPLGPDVARLIGGADELSYAVEMTGLTGGDAAKLLFSIKESVYKACAPLGAAELDFPDLTVRLDPAACAYDAISTEPAAPRLAGRDAVGGRYGFAEGLVFSTCVVAV